MSDATYDKALNLVLSDPKLCAVIMGIMARKVKMFPRRKTGMTVKMRELYEYIRDYCAANEGVSPSFDEMKDYLGLASKSGVHRLVLSLEERGMVVRLANRARAIIVVEKLPADRASDMAMH